MIYNLENSFIVVIKTQYYSYIKQQFITKYVREEYLFDFDSAITTKLSLIKNKNNIKKGLIL